jgi:hypothetical protein
MTRTVHPARARHWSSLGRACSRAACLQPSVSRGDASSSRPPNVLCEPRQRPRLRPATRAIMPSDSAIRPYQRKTQPSGAAKLDSGRAEQPDDCRVRVAILNFLVPITPATSFVSFAPPSDLVMRLRKWIFATGGAGPIASRLRQQPLAGRHDILAVDNLVIGTPLEHELAKNVAYFEEAKRLHCRHDAGA